jgi:hypothetical protein
LIPSAFTDTPSQGDLRGRLTLGDRYSTSVVRGSVERRAKTRSRTTGGSWGPPTVRDPGLLGRCGCPIWGSFARGSPRRTSAGPSFWRGFPYRRAQPRQAKMRKYAFVRLRPPGQ